MLSRIRRRLRYLYFIRLFCSPSPGGYFLQRCTCNLLATNLQEVIIMNFLTDKIKPMYFKYLKAAFGSALITSIYGIVDMSMVGQYQGPDGTAAWQLLLRSGTSSTALDFWWALADRYYWARYAVRIHFLHPILPMCFGSGSLWFAMPLTELVIAVYVVYHMWKYTHALPE